MRAVEYEPRAFVFYCADWILCDYTKANAAKHSKMTIAHIGDCGNGERKYVLRPGATCSVASEQWR